VIRSTGDTSGMPFLWFLVALVVVVFIGTRMVKNWHH
jgi:hypothetical protein